MHFQGTLQDALEAAANLCCCQGSGGGSGSGGGVIVPCCEDFATSSISWEVTGIDCGDVACLEGTKSGIELLEPACQVFIEDPPPGWQLREGDPTTVGFALACDDGTILSSIFINICCLELIADPTQTQSWVTVGLGFSAGLGTTRVYRLRTNQFDIGSCEAGVLEIINRPLELTESIGDVPCTFDDPRITIVFT